ncbi:DNA internalization-related competence protein ComEC/Rec2 [Comamonas phosphati]|nr:DNA internalization-related competence protein ComEC/Rec2 [Comamonas phosphati]
MWGCVLGAAWQVTQPWLWPLWVYQVLLCLGLVAAGLAPGRHCKGWSIRLLGLLCAASVTAAATGWRAHAYLEQTLPSELEGRDLVVQGTIASMLQNTAQGQRWRFEVEQAWPMDAGHSGQPERLFPAMIELAWYVPWGSQAASHPEGPAWAQGMALEPGQRWRMTVRVKRPHGARNPHGFDFELQQWEQGVQATGYVRESPPPQRLEVDAGYRMQRWRQWLRDRIRAQAAVLQRWWPALSESGRESAIGVVAALAVGDQQAVDRQDWTLFRQTGVAHLMSISGLHITMFAWLAAWATGRLWRLSARACQRLPAPRAALLAGAVLAAGYAMFSGWGVPAQRTVCMLAVVGILQWWGLRWPWPQVWLLALAVVLVADPWALWQAGFWLSFVAVGVLLATDRREQPPGETVTAAGKALGRTLDMWREQWLISLALAPLSLLLFGQVSVIGLVANLVAIPWITLLVTPLALASAVLPQAAALAALALEPLMALLHWLAGAPLAVLTLPQPAWWAGAVAIAAGLLLVAPLPGRVRAVAAMCCLPALWWPLPRPAWGEFEVLAADIGQGNAVLLSTRNHSLLYDAGPRYSQHSDAGERVLLPLFQSLGLRPDAMMLSHRDTDHTGGALSLYQALKAAGPAITVWGSDSVIHDFSLAALAPVRRCTAGERWQWDGVTFEVLHPFDAGSTWPVRGAKPSPNAGSCVLRLRSASGRVALLAGDIEAAQERQLVSQGLTGPLDWLLVPHHGSKTSSSAPWIEALAPRWAVVQAGYRNRFGHPVPAVVQRYVQAGSTVVRQDRCGAALWQSAQPEALLCERLIRAHYWDVHAAPLNTESD